MDPPCVIRRAEQASSAKPYGQHQPKRLHPACAHGLLPDTHYSRPRQSAGPSTGRTILRAPHPSRRHRKRFRSWRRPPLVSRSGRSPASAGTFFALLLRTHRRGPRSQDSSEKQVRLLSILRISPTQNQSLRFLQTAIHPISENLTPLPYTDCQSETHAFGVDDANKTNSRIDHVPNPVPESGYFTQAPTGHSSLAPKHEASPILAANGLSRYCAA